jgi:predicted GIY-YIG superfamily endonuclease
VVYSEQLPTLAAALRREKQIKHWTAKKKQALIQGRLSELKKLSKSRSRRTTVRS